MDPCSDPDVTKHKDYSSFEDICTSCLGTLIKHVDINYEMEYDTYGFHMRCYIGSVGFNIDKFVKEEINQKIFDEGVSLIEYSGYALKKTTTFTFDVNSYKTSDDTLLIDVKITPKK